MACNGERPPAKLSSAAAPFDLLTVDLVIYVLQSLPSLPALVRAACTCRQWRDLASDPDFRRRFRRTHPPPVLGLFFNTAPNVIPVLPSFEPVRHDDADLAKAILRGDFLLTPLYVSPHVTPLFWHVADSRCGLLLLMNWQTLHVALLNPLEKRVEGYFCLGQLDLTGVGPEDLLLEPRLICFDHLPSKFWIFFLRHNDRRVQVSMFSDTVMEGMMLPWMDAPARPDPDNASLDWLERGMVAGTYIYWFYKNYRHVIILFLHNDGVRCYSQEIPLSVYGPRDRYYVLGEDVAAAENLHPCPPNIVYVDGNTVFRLTGGAPGNLDTAWIREVVKDLGPDIESLLADLHMAMPQEGNQLAICELRDGFIYFTTSHRGQNVTTWFCSLNLETGQVDRLLCTTYNEEFQPYFIPWPRFLLDDFYDDEDEYDGDAESPSDSSKGSNDRGQDGPTFSQQMAALAPGPTSEKQLPKQPSSSQYSGAGPVQDVLKDEASWNGNCKVKPVLSEKIRSGIGNATLKILLDHHTNVRDHEPDPMQYSSRWQQYSTRCLPVQDDETGQCKSQLSTQGLQ